MEHAPKKRKFLGEDGDQKFASARLSKTAFSPGVGLEMVATAGGKKVSPPVQSLLCNSTNLTTLSENCKKIKKSADHPFSGGKVGGLQAVNTGWMPQENDKSKISIFCKQTEDLLEDVEDDNVVVSSEPAQVNTAARRNRRKYSVDFKVTVLEGYYNDPETHGNQRKTALKYGVNRRQIQKWLAQEAQLREQRDREEGTLDSQAANQQAGTRAANQSINQSEQREMPHTILSQNERLQSALLEKAEIMKSQSQHYFPTSTTTTSSSATISLKSPDLKDGRYGVNMPDCLINGSISHHQGMRHLLAEVPPSRPASLTSEARTAMRIFPRLSSTTKESSNLSVEIKKECTETESANNDEPMNLSKDVKKSEGEMSRTHADPLSTHILDTGTGMPARGVTINLYRMGGASSSPDNPAWMKVNSKLSNEDGRASAFLSWENFHPGTYKLHFNTGEYYAKTNTSTFYPFAEVVFEIRDPGCHYHVPLLLSPYSYSTYRGS